MIIVYEELCKGCNICTVFCPRKVYEQSKDLDKKGIHLPVPIHEEVCIKCTLCAFICPDQARKVEDEEDK